MTEALDTPVAAPSALDLLGGAGYQGESNYIAAPNYFSMVWKKSGDDAQVAAKASGLDTSKGNLLFAYTRGGVFNFLTPFNFYLVGTTEVFNLTDKKGNSLEYGSKKVSEDYREGFIALMVAVQGESLVPIVSTVGRIQGGTSKAFKAARLSAQAFNISSAELASRGEQFKVAAEVPSVPFRTVFTLTGTVKENDNGEFPVTSVSNRPVTRSDLDIVELAEPTNPESRFYKDLAECVKVYQNQQKEIREGWKAPKK